jgi:hypothetical protein
VVLIAIVSCNNKSYNSDKINSEDSNSELDVKEIKKSLSDNNYINTTGIITKVSYPSKNLLCEDSLTQYSFECLGKKLNLHVPCDYLRTSIFQYTEGQILTIHYQDSSRIRILCGYEAEISIEQELKDQLHSKRIKIDNYQITYEDVPKKRLKLFENSFRLMENDIRQE